MLTLLMLSIIVGYFCAMAYGCWSLCTGLVRFLVALRRR
jgi:hypothetical protein